MLRVMLEASHASPVRRGESWLGRPDLYLLQWEMWMGLLGALGLKVDSINPENKSTTHPREKTFLSVRHTAKKTTNFVLKRVDTEHSY